MKSRVPNERVNQVGILGGLVIYIRLLMTEILTVYQKTLKQIDFYNFFEYHSKTIGDIEPKLVPNCREKQSEKIENENNL